MKLSNLSAISLVLVMSSGAAFANVKQVKCDGFIVAVATEIAMAAEERAGSMTEAESNICEAAMQLDMPDDDPEVHNITILPYEIQTTVVLYPTAD